MPTTWNFFQRVLEDKARVTYSGEAWHVIVKPDFKIYIPIC